MQKKLTIFSIPISWHITSHWKCPDCPPSNEWTKMMIYTITDIMEIVLTSCQDTDTYIHTHNYCVFFFVWHDASIHRFVVLTASALKVSVCHVMCWMFEYLMTLLVDIHTDVCIYVCVYVWRNNMKTYSGWMLVKWLLSVEQSICRSTDIDISLAMRRGKRMNGLFWVSEDKGGLKRVLENVVLK